MSCGGGVTIFGLFPEDDITEEVEPCFISLYPRPVCEVIVDPADSFGFITTVPYSTWHPDGIDTEVPDPLSGLIELKSNTKEDNIDSNISIPLAELRTIINHYSDISEDGVDSTIAIQGAELNTIIIHYTDISEDGADSSIAIQGAVLDTIIIHTEVYSDGTLEDIESNISIISGALV